MASEPVSDLSFQTETIRVRAERVPQDMATNSNKSIIPRLSILIPTLLAVWLATVVALHGPAMIGYVVLHLATTGLFAYGMWKTEQKYLSGRTVSTESPMLTKPSSDDAAKTQDADVAAVAS